MRIPDLRDRAGLGEGALGLVLAGVGVGALAASIYAGPLIARLGSAPVLRAALPLLTVTLALVGVASSGPALLAGAVLFGLALGAQDVAMNAHGVTVELARGRGLLSRLHAMFSLGTLASAGLGALVIRAGVGPTPHLAGMAVVLLLAFVASRGLLGAEADREAPGRAGAPGLRARLGALRERLASLRHPWLLAAVGVTLASFVAENSVGEWSGVFLRDDRGAQPAVAALGYVALAGAMVVGRLVGDRLTERVGDERTLVLGGAVAAAGWLVVVLVPSAGAAIAAWLLVGFAVANVVPVAFRSAGARRVAGPGERDLPAPAEALAATAGAGYAGGLIGPGVIGGLAAATSLQAALLLPTLLAASIVLLGPIAVRGARP